MADPGEEKKTRAPKAVANSNAISIESTSDSDSESGNAAHLNEKHGDDIERIESRSDQEDDKHKEPLAATRSHATDASVATTTAAARYAEKPWYKKVNPMRWGPIPEVPKERIVSREYQAGFFSKLTFQWVNPLMTVSFH
jgi:ATP-binding cassette subfamily C (CFTR/MRP) protein 1